MRAAAGRPASVARRVALWVAIVLPIAFGITAHAAEQAKKAGAKASRKLADASSEVLVWVAEKPITRGDFEARLDQLSPQFRQQFSTPEGRKQLLDRMVQEQVWTLAAERAGVAKRPEVIRQLEQTRRDIIVRSYLQEVMQSMPAPADSQVQSFYESHKTEPGFSTPEARRVRHIQLDSEKEAVEVMRRLNQGGNFAELAKKLSKDKGTSENGGEVGRLERNGSFAGIGRQPALSESSYSAPIGKPVGPIRSTVGWHVLEVEEKIPSSPIAMENVRPRILQMLNRDAQEKFYQSQLEKAKASVGYRMNQAVVDSFLFGRKSSADLFREAQQAPTADERLASYEKVVSEYPLSEHAPQAQFMIGFIYSEEKKDYDKAEVAFKKLLADYPKSELKNSAQWMIDHMRTDAVPNFDLPGGVKRSTDTVKPAAADTSKAQESKTPRESSDGKESQGSPGKPH